MSREGDWRSLDTAVSRQDGEGREGCKYPRNVSGAAS